MSEKMSQETDEGTDKSTMKGSEEELLAEGKRCLAAGDVASAVESFQSACSVMADQYGQLSKELAEPYYLYGKALLECARIENTVLGSGIPVPDDRVSSDDEEDEGEEKGEEEEEKEEGEGEGGEGGESGKVEAEDDPSNTHADETATPQTSTGAGGGPSAEGEEKEGGGEEPVHSDGAGPSREKAEEGEGEEGEETDLSLAWEVLELARVICQKEDTDEFKLKLSDVYFALGEVALESDQIDQAVAEMNSGLQLKELLLEHHDRRLAEAHFNLGLAYALQKDSKRSIQEYKCARNTLSLRKEKLVGEMEKKGERSDRREMEEELADLDSLLPDLDAKISDACAEEEKQNEEVTTSFGFSESASTEETANNNSSNKAPISDISHLVRKRPAVAADSGDSSVEGNAPKRIRIEEPSASLETKNTTAATNGTASSAPEL